MILALVIMIITGVVIIRLTAAAAKKRSQGKPAKLSALASLLES